MQAVVKLHSIIVAAGLATVLAGCGGGYQAPIEDRSTTLERSPPLIVSNGQTVPATPRQAPVATSSSSTAQAGGSPVGAATTVVRPVTISPGISSTGISRAPQTDTVPEQPAAGSQAPSPSPVPSPSPSPSPSPVPDGASSSAPASAPSTSAPATAPAPATSAPSTSPSATPAAATSYEVARGDTLYSIAWNHSIDYRTLALVNDLDEPYTIFPGQRLVISESGVSAAAIRAMPDIPAAPAGEEAMSATGRRPQAAMEGRRTGNVAVREMEGVSWQWPIDGRVLPGSGSGRGLELDGNAGEPVYAAADGDVVFAGRGIQGAGNLVILRHSARHLSAYMHNSLMLVVEGDRVQAGDKIAEVGTGSNGREMLRFEVRVDGAPADPQRYLPPR